MDIKVLRGVFTHSLLLYQKSERVRLLIRQQLVRKSVCPHFPRSILYL